MGTMKITHSTTACSRKGGCYETRNDRGLLWFSWLLYCIILIICCVIILKYCPVAVQYNMFNKLRLYILSPARRFRKVTEYLNKTQQSQIFFTFKTWWLVAQIFDRNLWTINNIIFKTCYIVKTTPSTYVFINTSKFQYNIMFIVFILRPNILSPTFRFWKVTEYLTKG